MLKSETLPGTGFAVEQDAFSVLLRLAPALLALVAIHAKARRANRRHNCHKETQMQFQNLVLAASLSALLAVSATATAAENTAQGNAQEKRAVREKEAAEKKEVKMLEKNDGKGQKAQAKRAQKGGDANPNVADETKNADNTKINTRDRKDTLTPMDQSNGAAQIAITADVRKGIMGDKSISFTGKNVKVITVGTKVTLRGPVKSTKERTAIEGIAKRTAGVSDVDNQLEVTN